jgi:hypothetical protein
MQAPELKVKPVLHWVHTVVDEQVEHALIPLQSTAQLPELNTYPELHAPQTLAEVQL